MIFHLQLNSETQLSVDAGLESFNYVLYFLATCLFFLPTCGIGQVVMNTEE